ncbi:PQQ-dependent sugar dehydrogenase [Jonesia quinghaiensis]|uniref:PQQ-dependent sugar dehydrogenase n=1 Tax=Jonesia quinghaiensis TaxID=262806 RepID=UPI000419263E|nr:PQQ-dependent sugar dehydrogenase [Jonesia quinghaiensis]
MLLWGSSSDQSARSSLFSANQMASPSHARQARRAAVGGALALVLFTSACSGGTPDDAQSSQPQTTSPTGASPSESIEEGASGDVSVAIPTEVTLNAVSTVSAPAVDDTVAMARLSPGSVLAVERDGTLWLIDDTGEQQVDSETLTGLRERIATDVERTEAGVAGVMGIAVEGTIETATVFFTVSTGTTTSVLAMPWDGQTINQGRTIVEGLPAGNGVNGGALGIGPEGYLYVSVGDAGQPDLAQNLESLAGKILRYRTDGVIPQSNPLTDSPIWSSGHHEVVSFAWANEGHMFAVERGGQYADELNSIRGGENYGWPLMEGDRVIDRGALLAGSTGSATNEGESGATDNRESASDGQDDPDTQSTDADASDQDAAQGSAGTDTGSNNQGAQGDEETQGEQNTTEEDSASAASRLGLTAPIVQWEHEASPDPQDQQTDTDTNTNPDTDTDSDGEADSDGDNPPTPDTVEPTPFGDVASITAGDFAVIVSQSGDGRAWWIPIPQSTNTERLTAQEILTDTTGPLGWVETTADMTELTVHGTDGLTTFSITPQSWTEGTSSTS